MTRFRLCQILFGLALSSVTLRILPLAVLCYKQKLRDASVITFSLKLMTKNYPVNDKELLAMKYALVESRVYLPGSKTFVVYVDHASLRIATQSPHR